MPGMDNDKADKLVNKKVTGAERRMGVGAEGKMDAWSHWQNCEVFTAIQHHRSISTAAKDGRNAHMIGKKTREKEAKGGVVRYGGRRSRRSLIHGGVAGLRMAINLAKAAARLNAIHVANCHC